MCEVQSTEKFLGSRDRTRTLGLLGAGNFVLENGNKASKVAKETAK